MSCNCTNARQQELEAEVERLKAALTQSVKVIRVWHAIHNINDAQAADLAWRLYCRNAPEMKLILAALGKEGDDAGESERTATGAR